jgi:hypothetical protein
VPAPAATIGRRRREHTVQCVERALQVARFSRERPQLLEASLDLLAMRFDPARFQTMSAWCSSRCAVSGHPSLCSLRARSCSFEQVPQYRAAPWSWGQHNSREARRAHSWGSWARTGSAQP